MLERTASRIAAIAFVALSMLIAQGCGGSSSSGFGSTAGSPAMPMAGVYKSPYSRTTANMGTVLIQASSTGELSFGVDDQASGTAFFGSTTVGSNDTYSGTLTSSSNTQVTVSGTTYANHILVSISGVFSTSDLEAQFIGNAVNPFTGTYSGTLSGGLSGSTNPLSISVNSSASANLTGTFGSASISGTLSPVGVFSGTATSSSVGGPLTLAGVFTIGKSNSLVGAGTWVDTTNALNTGIWTASRLLVPGKP